MKMNRQRQWSWVCAPGTERQITRMNEDHNGIVTMEGHTNALRPDQPLATLENRRSADLATRRHDSQGAIGACTMGTGLAFYPSAAGNVAVGADRASRTLGADQSASPPRLCRQTGKNSGFFLSTTLSADTGNTRPRALHDLARRPALHAAGHSAIRRWQRQQQAHDVRSPVAWLAGLNPANADYRSCRYGTALARPDTP